MARPYKARRICSVPAIDTFGPLNQEMDSAVELTLEEYETIRLIDWLDCTQEQCADQMGVARTTVQAVYNSARKKLADCLPVPAAEDLPLPEGGATAYSFQLPEIEVTMEADSWIGVVFIATDNLGRTSTNGEFFTLRYAHLHRRYRSHLGGHPDRSGQRITSP